MAKVFVFGSNRAGRHGKGAALYALQHHGAIYGIGEGIQGTSYAIPTKDFDLSVLSIDEIRRHVFKFMDFARGYSDVKFQVTPIGCGLAGYSPLVIAPLFEFSPDNVQLPDEFLEVLHV